ncbi:MAG: relaxase/mobilization nuclease domain-containing protein [Zoogloea sp.]|nr:relaxase/mobilization nuclease domain-containing protein [Zoogloea sp.]
MIAKHVPMRSLGKSDFAGLAKYITDAQSKDHRLGLVLLTNCAAATLPVAIEEVLATQYINTRAKSDKTYHLIVSFRTGEQPSADTLKAIEERISAGLGYGEHQRVSAVHNDTDNLHVHIAINKIHPTRHTIHEPYYPHRTLAELCEVLERDYNLERDNHVPSQRGAAARAADMERHAGVESLVGWIKRECLEEIRGATSWAELHQVMRDNGLELRARGNGLVIEAGDGTSVKASTLARDLSKSALEARLGGFEAAPERREAQVKRSYRKDPVRLRIDTTELYAKYKDEQKTLTAARAEALAKAKRQKDLAIENAKKKAATKRAAIKLTDGRLTKKLLYAQVSRPMQNP